MEYKISKQLPQKIKQILLDNNAPSILQRHLEIVYNTSDQLVIFINSEYPKFKIDKKEVLFGSATHDIGKTIKTQELYGLGHEHEELGYNLLLEAGIKKNLARFTITHGEKKINTLAIEDLLVILADKVWKGKRLFDLEQLIAKKIADNLGMDVWEVFTKLDVFLSELSVGTDSRLKYQMG